MRAPVIFATFIAITAGMYEAWACIVVSTRWINMKYVCNLVFVLFFNGRGEAVR